MLKFINSPPAFNLFPAVHVDNYGRSVCWFRTLMLAMGVGILRSGDFEFFPQSVGRRIICKRFVLTSASNDNSHHSRPPGHAGKLGVSPFKI